MKGGIFTEHIIKLIVETDKASRLDVDNALKYREEVSQELAQKKELIDAQYKKEAEDKITKARIVAQKEADSFKEDLTALKKKKADKLQLAYEQNHEDWEKTILQNVISK